MLLGLVLFLIFGIGVAVALLCPRHRHQARWIDVLSGLAFRRFAADAARRRPAAHDQTPPDWLFIASRFNPLSYLVDAERALFRGELFTTEIGLGFLVAGITAAIGLLIGALTIRRPSL